LFIAGFGSSMLFGTFVGALADKYGRKRMSVAYAAFYGIACITKLYNNFGCLLLGRVLSGIATSLLFSSFESWMVAEHHKADFAPAWLSQTFSHATLGNGVVAIGAGLAASYVADEYGFVAPFMLALAILVLCGLAVFFTWGENFGDSKIDVSGRLSQRCCCACRRHTRPAAGPRAVALRGLDVHVCLHVDAGARVRRACRATRLYRSAAVWLDLCLLHGRDHDRLAASLARSSPRR
jgi:MFS family permease